MPLLLLAPFVMGLFQTELFWPIAMGVGMAVVGVLMAFGRPAVARAAQLEGAGTVAGRAVGTGAMTALLYGSLCLVCYGVGYGLANIFG